MHNRADYRIRNSKKTEDDLDLDFQEHLKISPHISRPKRESSAALTRKHNESQQNSRLKQSRMGSGFGSNVGSRVGRVLRMSKSSKDQNVVTDIQFNNVRWISIVSAYDSKRLRHVTVSKQSCENFLKKYGNGIKNDPAAMAYLRDIKKHFRSWLTKINEAFVLVLDQFLSNGEKSPLVSLQKVGPILQEIRSDTAMMQQKLTTCLKIYQNSDFRKMAQKFKGFFKFSSSLEELIAIIFQKKQKIDDLFYELENDKNVDKMIQKIKKEGMKQTHKLVYNQTKYSPNLCDRIMQKVSCAINDMATKSLDLFHRLQGAKQLINRIKKILNDANKRLTIKQIRKFSQIFHEVLQQTNKFEEFVDRFDSDNDFVTAQLKEKIHLCKDDLLQKKKTVAQMQAIFVGTVISETISILHNNHSLNNTFNQQVTQYQEYNHLLQAIADAMLDQTKKAITEGLVKQNRISFVRLQEDLEKVRRSFRKNEQGLVIDTENGQVATMECSKLTKDYKDKVKNLIKKHEDALKNLNVKVKDIKLPTSDKDPELVFLAKLSNISEIVNSRQRHNKIMQQRGFLQCKQGIGISATQIQQAYALLENLQGSRVKIMEINKQNPLKRLIKNVRTQNGLYQQCSYLLSIFRLIGEATQKNLIQVLSKISQVLTKKKNQLQKENFYKQSKAYRFIVQRLHCLALVKGLKKNIIKQLDDPKLMVFPQNEFELKQMENQSKYRNLILNSLSEQIQLPKNKIKRSLQISKDFITARKIIDRLKANQNGQFVALVSELSTFSYQVFKVCFLSEKSGGNSTEARRFALQLAKCLKSKANNIDMLQRQVDIEYNQALLKVRTQIIYYKNLNQNSIAACQKVTKDQDSDPLHILSQVTFIISEYIHQTKQKVYLALNEFKQPIWVGNPQQSKDGIAQEINLKGYPRGTFVDSYTHQAAKAFDVKNKPTVSAKKIEKQENVVKELQNSPGKIILKQKSHPRDAMDEQIEAIESDKEMIQEMGEDVQQVQDMGQQIDPVEDDMEEQIADDMGEEIEQSQMEQNLGQEIDQYSVEIQKPKMMVVNKIEQVQKKQNKPQPSKQQVSLSTVYEVIPFFKELQQIRQLFQKINNSQRLFWKEYVDFHQIQDFYHRQQSLKDRNNFTKSLQNSYSMFLGNKFGPKLGEIVKNLDKIKPIKGLILSLGQKNWQQLFKILEIVQRNYSILVSNKAQILQVFTYNGDNLEFRKQVCKKCVQNFIENKLKTQFFVPETFNLQGYIANCYKIQTEQLINSDGVSFHYAVRYTAKGAESLPTSDINQKLKSLKNIEAKFQKDLLTGINMGYTSLQFWVKALQSNNQDCYKPDTSILDGYTKQLGKLDKKQWICHYLRDFCQQMSGLKAKIKSHKNTIENLLFKIDSSNVVQCQVQLSELYKIIPQKKLYYVDKSEKILLYSSRKQTEGILNESQLVVLIQGLFETKLKNDGQNTIQKQQIITYLQKAFKSKKLEHSNERQMMEMLNILKIEHYYLREPQFVFKNTLQTLVFSCLKNLQATKPSQLSYEELFNDLFQQKSTAFSHQLIIKQEINKQILSKKDIQKSRQQLKTLTTLVSNQKSAFRQNIKKMTFNQLFLDIMRRKQKQNELFVTFINYKKKLEDCKSTVENVLKNKSKTILIYVNTFKANVEQLQKIIVDQMAQINDISQQLQKSSTSQEVLKQTDNIFKSLIKWAKQTNVVNEFTSFSISQDQKTFIFNLQFSAFKSQDKVKQFLTHTLRNNWLKDSKWTGIWDYTYEKYIQKYNKIQKLSTKHTEIVYNLQSSIKDIVSDVRLDLADKEDVIQFTKIANKQRFSKTAFKNDNLTKSNSKIMARLNFKKRLCELKQIILSNEFVGLSSTSAFNKFKACLKEELDIDQKKLTQIISLTKAVNKMDLNLTELLQWYKILGHDQLKNNYFELKSSKNTLISLLPVLKIEKDNAKNKQEIERLLSEIEIHSKYNIKLQKGVQVIYLQPQVIHCCFHDKQGFLNDKAVIQDFEPEVAEGQMLIFVIEQINDANITLWISTSDTTAEVIVSINQNNVKADLSCGIWRISKDDYENIKNMKISSKQEENTAIRKKLRGLASPQQRIRQIKLGEKVNFLEVGQWLKNQIKKFRIKRQQKQRSEQQRLRQIEMLRKESQTFISSIYEELQKQNIPVYNLSLKEIEEKKGELEQKENDKITGYFKATSTKTLKIIQKLQETKSRQQITRLNSLTKAYMKALDDKLVQNYVIQSGIILKAKEQFEKIVEERQIEKMKKQEAKKAKRQSKFQRLQRIKKLQEALKANQPSKAPLPQKTQNNNTNTVNVPSLQTDKNVDNAPPLKPDTNTLNAPSPDPQEPQKKPQEPLKKPSEPQKKPQETQNKPQQLIQAQIESLSKQSQPQNYEDFDIIELIMEMPKQTNKKTQDFLIEWLEYQEPKDVDYYRCLLKGFSKLPSADIISLTELK